MACPTGHRQRYKFGAACKEIQVRQYKAAEPQPNHRRPDRRRYGATQIPTPLNEASPPTLTVRLDSTLPEQA
jgi:hypothetical protein